MGGFPFEAILYRGDTPWCLLNEWYLLNEFLCIIGERKSCTFVFQVLDYRNEQKIGRAHV